MNHPAADRPDTEADPFSAYTLRDPEAFARNIAHMLEHLGRAAAHWVEPRERGEVRDGPISYTDVASTLSKVAEYWVSDNQRALQAQTKLMTGMMGVWSQSLLRSMGQPIPSATQTSDKRFKDEEWSKNTFFAFLRDGYTVFNDWSASLVRDAEGIDPHTKLKAVFYSKVILNALSPANFVATNPELYRETISENGANLVRGMQMFAEDMARGEGFLKLRQSCEASFRVGDNVATTPGKVVAENDLCQIIQYAPLTETVFKRPILISPPWINRFYILDLNAEKSLIRWIVEQGHTVFVISWVNPDARHADKDWQAYIEEGLVFGLDTVKAATGEDEVNAIGYCVGGTLLCAALPYLKARGDERIRSATLLTTQIDFRHSGDLKVFIDEAQLAELEKIMERGYLEGTRMAATFNLLRSGELIWPYVVNNYIRGKEPTPFDLLFWNADATRMARANHLFYLRACYFENQLSRGRMEIGGVRLDLSTINIPVYNLATREDHIAPAISVYEGSLALGSRTTYVVSGSGHIAGVVNPPSRGKYRYWTGPSPSPDLSFEDWWTKTEETPGSWWPHWQTWIEASAGDRVAARQPGGDRFDPIEDAPGRYVLG